MNNISVEKLQQLSTISDEDLLIYMFQRLSDTNQLSSKEFLNDRRTYNSGCALKFLLDDFLYAKHMRAAKIFDAVEQYTIDREDDKMEDIKQQEWED